MNVISGMLPVGRGRDHHCRRIGRATNHATAACHNSGAPIEGGSSWEVRSLIVEGAGSTPAPSVTVNWA